ncbi:MAG: hypothetical protein J1E34_10035 [Oscillospiraceae bacterium]|nr:hypothetical protein [Oscillospiraceae bacterium]
MKLDFTKSVEDWVNYFKRLFDIVASFFEYIGIKLFPDSSEDEGAEPPVDGE